MTGTKQGIAGKGSKCSEPKTGSGGIAGMKKAPDVKAQLCRGKGPRGKHGGKSGY